MISVLITIYTRAGGYGEHLAAQFAYSHTRAGGYGEHLAAQFAYSHTRAGGYTEHLAAQFAFVCYKYVHVHVIPTNHMLGKKFPNRIT